MKGCTLKRLEGKTALVTGAARGIGAAIASAFVENGAFVYLSDINDAQGHALAASLGGHACYIHLDVREECEWQAAMAQVLHERAGLHVLVNNAGITGFEDGCFVHNPEHVSLEDWLAVHRTNLDGVFLGCKHALVAMRRLVGDGRRGSIVNIASRSGAVGVAAAAAYASSKAAVRNHTRSVALYCAEQGLPVRCNAIMPAAILTPMWEPMLGQGADRETNMAAFVADTPLRRFGTAAEVAALAVMLASDECLYMTGSELHVDGGLLAGSVAAPRTR